MPPRIKKKTAKRAVSKITVTPTVNRQNCFKKNVNIGRKISSRKQSESIQTSSEEFPDLIISSDAIEVLRVDSNNSSDSIKLADSSPDFTSSDGQSSNTLQNSLLRGPKKSKSKSFSRRNMFGKIRKNPKKLFSENISDNSEKETPKQFSSTPVVGHSQIALNIDLSDVPKVDIVQSDESKVSNKEYSDITHISPPKKYPMCSIKNLRYEPLPSTITILRK